MCYHSSQSTLGFGLECLVLGLLDEFLRKTYSPLCERISELRKWTKFGPKTCDFDKHQRVSASNQPKRGHSWQLYSEVWRKPAWVPKTRVLFFGFLQLLKPNCSPVLAKTHRNHSGARKVQWRCWIILGGLRKSYVFRAKTTQTAQILACLFKAKVQSPRVLVQLF